VINSLAGGGAEKLLTDLLPRLRDRGVEVELLLLSGSPNELTARLMRSGIPVRFSGARGLYSPLQVLAIRKAWHPFEIVHAHLFPTFLYVALAASLLRGKVAIYTEHSTTNRRRKHGPFKLVDSWAYSRYARVVCISRGVKETLTGYLPRIEGKCLVVHNGIDLAAFGAGSNSPLPRQTRLVACVANLLPGKGQDVLIRAAALLPPDVQVALAGRGPHEGKLRELARDLGVLGRIRFLGYVHQVSAVYREARICVVPSLWEGFGMAAVEAMASGVPVVASRTPGLAEVVGDAGLLFEAGNPSELAGKIAQLLKSEELWAEQRRKGIERAEKFSVDRMAEEYCRIYAAVGGEGS
jgi:glycosyltransferase involved in cell wall biosynthesis